MKNRTEAKVTVEMIDRSGITDEYIFRDLARKMVSDMPMSELQKLIRLTKIDPRTKDSIDKMNNPDIPPYEKSELRMLREQGVILFKAECDFEDKKRNENLMAAAPDLLEALIMLMGGVAGLPPLSPINGVLQARYELAEKAVKKALSE